MDLKKRDSGQIALILVLVMTVIAGATVALSGRTTVETRVQEINVDSSQAMLAAESGLEQALKNYPSAAVTGTLGPNSSFSVGDSVVAANQNIYKGIKRGETVEIFTTGQVGVGSVNVYWSPVGTDTTPRAIFVTEVRPTGLKDYAFDTVGGAGTGFSVAGPGANGFTYSANIPIDVTTTEVRVTVLGGDSDVGFTANAGSLPPQLRDKPVVGTVTRGTGAKQEKVQYGIDYKQSINGEIPEVFEYALFSGKSISQ